MKKEPKTSMQELIERTQSYLTYFFERFDSLHMEKLVEKLAATQGILFLTGVGKSGAVAKKIASTLSSSGTRALYLSPMDALHGDIGIVSKNDVVFLLSKSGESVELLELCPALRNKGAFLVAVVSNEQSKLSLAADTTIFLPLERELCPFNMIPTTSAIIQLIFGELLTVSLMQKKQFTLDEYSRNHAAGRIGKRVSLFVRDLMVPQDKTPMVAPHKLLKDVLDELSNKKSGCLVVVDDKKNLLGLFTDGDLRRSLQKHGGEVMDKPISDLMTKNPRFASSSMRAFDALTMMESDQKRPIMVLPIVDDGIVQGLLRMHDLIQAGL